MEQSIILIGLQLKPLQLNDLQFAGKGFPFPAFLLVEEKIIKICIRETLEKSIEVESVTQTEDM